VANQDWVLVLNRKMWGGGARHGMLDQPSGWRVSL